MKIIIDTDNKTLGIVNEITMQELNKFVEEYKLENYKIIPRYNIEYYPYTIPSYTAKPIINPQYPVTY